MRLGLVALVSILVLPAVAAPVHAQAPSPSVQPQIAVDVADPGTPLAFGRVNPLTVVVTYDFPPGSFTQDNILVALDVKETPVWVKIAFAAPVISFTPDPTGVRPPQIPPSGPPSPPSPMIEGGHYAKTVIVNASLTPDAPADTKANFSIKATAKPSGNLAGAEGESPPIFLKAAWLTKLNLTAPAGPMYFGGGRAVPITFHVVNEGNAPVLLSFAVTGKPQYSVVTTPGNLTSFKPHQAADVTVMLRTPWTQVQRGPVELEATPHHGKDIGEAERASVDVVGSSVVPGPPLGLALGALLVVALLARRRV